MFSGDAELVEDLLGNFAGRTETRVDHRVRLMISSGTRVEEFADFGQRIGGLQQWAVDLDAHPLPNGLGRRPQTDHHGVRFEAVQVGGIGDEAAAGGNDDVLPGLEGLGGVFLEFAECLLAVLGEDIGDGLAGLAFNPFIGIDKVEVKMLGDNAPDGGFAGAHEADEGNVVNDPRILALHGAILTPKKGGMASISINLYQAFNFARVLLVKGARNDVGFASRMRH